LDAGLAVGAFRRDVDASGFSATAFLGGAFFVDFAGVAAFLAAVSDFGFAFGLAGAFDLAGAFALGVAFVLALGLAAAFVLAVALGLAAAFGFAGAFFVAAAFVAFLAFAGAFDFEDVFVSFTSSAALSSALDLAVLDGALRVRVGFAFVSVALSDFAFAFVLLGAFRFRLVGLFSHVNVFCFLGRRATS